MRYNLAVALYKGSRFGEAATELESVLKAKPDHPQAPLLLADCRLLLGEWKAVIAILDPLLERDPENKAILYMLGTALMRDRQRERGQRVLDRILRQGDSAEAHLVLAIASREANDDIAAEKELRRALELDPNLPTANGTLGDVLVRMGEGAAAIAALQRELEVNPNHFDSHLLLGLLLRQESRTAEAMTHLRKALALRPGDAGVRYQIALVQIAESDLAAARATLEALVARGAAFTEAHVSLATVYYRLGLPRGRPAPPGDRAAAQARREGPGGRGEGSTAGDGRAPALSGGLSRPRPPRSRTPDGSVRPMASATRRVFSIRAGNSWSGTACGPSERATAGSGCVSTISPSAPQATPASVRLSTQSRFPAACDGSTITGRPSLCFAIGTAATSSVKRVAVSKVRIPRSHRTTSWLPSCRMYSAAWTHSSIVQPKPRLSMTGMRERPSAFSSGMFCMFRLPTWAKST